MTLQKVGKNYVNPEEISHITYDCVMRVGIEHWQYTMHMKNKEIFTISEKDMKEYIHGHFRYTEPNYNGEDERDF